MKSFDQNTFSASFPAVFPAPKERFLHAKNPAGAWAFFTGFFPAHTKIVVLSDGVVAEQGAPDALYARNGQYTHMVDLQTESQSWVI